MNAKTVTIQEVIALLNEAAQLDSEAIRALVDHQVPCNYNLADHPTIQVGCTEDGEPRLGVLGIINGLFGVDENAHGPVIADVPDDPAEPPVFSLNPNFEKIMTP